MKKPITITQRALQNLITEIVRQYSSSLLNEGISNILYHFTSLSNVYNICKSDTIFLQSAFAKDSDNFDKKRKYYLSCTRMPSAQYGYSYKFNRGGARIVLDGTKLSQTLKGKPVNYWGGGVFNDKFKYYETLPRTKEDADRSLAWPLHRYKQEHPDATEQDIENYRLKNFNDEAQHHTGNESEDRIFSYSPVIENAHKYIISIDVLLPNYDTNEEDKQFAYALTTSSLGRWVKIFSSSKEFNSPKGKPINDQIGYYDNITNKYDNRYDRPHRDEGILISALSFIAAGNPALDKYNKDLGRNVSDLLDRYGLDQFKGAIGKIIKEIKNSSSTRTIENFDSVRRELSDTPSRTRSRILKMVTDHLLSIGANSFTDACKIKKKMEDELWYEKGYSYRDHKNVDYDKSVNLLILNNRVIILNPDKELFINTINKSDEDLKYMADSIASDVMYDKQYGEEGKYQNVTSKNTNSLFQYLYKLFRKGTVSQVMNGLAKIGLPKDYLNGFNLKFETKNIKFSDTWDYETPTTNKIKSQDWNYDYRKLSNLRDKELEPLFINDNKQ